MSIMNATLFAFAFLLAACSAVPVAVSTDVGDQTTGIGNARKVSYLRVLQKNNNDRGDKKDGKNGGDKKEEDEKEKEGGKEDEKEKEGGKEDEKEKEGGNEDKDGPVAQDGPDGKDRPEEQAEGDETNTDIMDTESETIDEVANAGTIDAESETVDEVLDTESETIDEVFTDTESETVDEVFIDTESETVETYTEIIDNNESDEIVGTNAGDIINSNADAFGADLQRLDSQEEKGMKPVGKAFLSLAVIGVSAAVIFLVVRRRRNAKAANSAYAAHKDESAPPSNSKALILVDTIDTIDSKELVPVDNAHLPEDTCIDVVLDGQETTTIEVSNVDEVPPLPEEGDSFKLSPDYQVIEM